MSLLNTFQRKTPNPADLCALSAGDYKNAAQRSEELQREIRKWRAKPPSLKDCMGILEQHAATRRAQFEALVDLRLAELVRFDFDPGRPEEAEFLDLHRFLAPRELGRFVAHEAIYGLMTDRLLQVAEERLKAMGCGKGPSMAEKRSRLAELEAEYQAVSAVRDDALRTWRHMTNQPAGYPA